MPSWKDRAIPADQAGSWKDRAEPVEKAATLGEVAQSTADGFAQGATLGHADEISAGLGGLVDYVQGKMGMRGEIDLSDAYNTRLKAVRKGEAETKEKAPTANKVGMVLGGLAPAFAFTGGAAAVPSLGRTIATGVGAGAAAGSGMSEGDIGSAEHLVDTGTGAVLGGVGAGAGYGVGKGLGKLHIGDKVRAFREKFSQSAKGLAERRATTAATGEQAKFMDPLVRKGKVEERGRILLDKGIVKFGRSSKNIAGAAEDVADEAGGKIGEVLKQIDDEGAIGVNSARIADKIDEYANSIASPNNRGVVENLRNQAKEFRGMFRVSGSDPKQGITLKEANRFKQLYKWDDRDPAANMAIGREATNKINRIISEELDDAVKVYATVPRPEGLKAATAIDPKDALKVYLQSKKNFHHSIGAKQSAEKLASREQKNQFLSLKDTLAGGGGLALSGGNPLVAIPMVVANKFARERGSASLAVLADKLAKFLKSPTSAEVLGMKYGPMIQQAAQKGDKALGAVHNMLLKSDPEYTNLITTLLDVDTKAMSAKALPESGRSGGGQTTNQNPTQNDSRQDAIQRRLRSK